MTRRDFTLAGLGALAAAAAMGSTHGRAATPEPVGQKADRDGQNTLRVAFLLFEGLTALDMVGPATVFGGPSFAVDYVWRDKKPVYSEAASGRMGIMPTATFDEVASTDILCVPGTSNPYAQIVQKDLVDWVALVGQKARWVTSVCTGSFILGAAGLLKGYRATAHWTMVDELAYFGAVPVHERVVVDRNRVTGAGVTSGIDFGLSLLTLLRGENEARAKQLTLEYDPAPPFTGGSPKSADPAMVKAARAGFAEHMKKTAPYARQSLEDAAKRLEVSVSTKLEL